MLIGSNKKGNWNLLFLICRVASSQQFSSDPQMVIGWVSEKSKEVELFCPRILHFPLLDYTEHSNKWKLRHVERDVSEICVQICFVTNNITAVTAL
jgi:NAD-dependent SIR2 family protein deacetylase